MTVKALLDERGAEYGDFAERAQLCHALLADLSVARRWDDLAPVQRHALGMIVDKISRITNGDPFKADSWRDIAGYAMLIVDWMERAEARTAPDAFDNVRAPRP